MPTYKTPGVFVEERSTLPPSVAEVSTAVPAFIGCTEKHPEGSGPVVARINTLLEYEQTFGGPQLTAFNVDVTADGRLTVTKAESGKDSGGVPRFLLYYQLSHYFKNGGGTCYIVSVGSYKADPAKGAILDGLGRLELEDEPTLILLADAVSLDRADYHEVCQAALAQCQKLGDRFVILDVKRNGDSSVNDVSAFRDELGTRALSYGAAYYPYLETTLSYAYQESGVTVSPGPLYRRQLGANTILVTYANKADDTPQVILSPDDKADRVTFSVKDRTLTITFKDQSGADVVAAWNTWTFGNSSAAGFGIVQAGSGSGRLAQKKDTLPLSRGLAALQSLDTALYSQIKSLLATQRVTLPPSGAIAGIYASTDRERGVWKAPANVSISAVIGPVKKISDDAQQDLNVDANSGKSINAIRSFAGKGTLVWGARTLAGNDNEWRYVSVRRLFIMIEESARKSTAFAVFEPNDLTTWLKVKGMIDSFLYGLWERGALAGSKPDQAYFVNVGLGKTMTPQDILEGRMNVEIGIAAVRPAEFIILRFSHKLQEA